MIACGKGAISAGLGIGLGAAIVASAAPIVAAVPMQAAQREAGAGVAAPRAAGGACGGVISAALSAAAVRVCDPVTVTTRVRSHCPSGCDDGVHVVLILNERPCCWGAPWEKGSAIGAVRALADAFPDVPVRVGVVLYDDESSRAAAPLLDVRTDVSRVRSAIERVQMYGSESGDFRGAGRNALTIFAQGHTDSAGNRLRPCQVAVFFGYNVELLGSPEMMRKDAEIAALGRTLAAEAELVVGCLGAGEACTAVGRMPHEGRYQIPAPSSLQTNIPRFTVDAVHSINPSAAVLRSDAWQLVSAGLSVVVGSASPAPAAVRAAGDATRIGWRWDAPAASEPQTVTFRLRPLAEGEWPIAGSLVVTDTRMGAQVVPMDPVTLTVAGLCETPTSEPSPTRTPVPSPPPPTLAPTSAPSPTVKPTPTPDPPAAYLPLALRERCTPEKRRVDVALVLDASSSMGEPVPAGGTKMDAARSAVLAFLDELHLADGDQAALVAFHDDAVLARELTDDRQALERGLAAIMTGRGTRIHLGIEIAQRELFGSRRRPDNTPAMVVLTDGRANPEPVDLAVAQAQAAKQAGITVFTIGLGGDVELDALERMASRSEYSYRAPTADALAAIYRAIAVSIPCPSGGFWGRR